MTRSSSGAWPSLSPATRRADSARRRRSGAGARQSDSPAKLRSGWIAATGGGYDPDSPSPGQRRVALTERAQADRENSPATHRPRRLRSLMALSLTRTTDGTVSNANANLNNNWTAIETLLNGNLDATNLAADAVGQSEIAANAVTTAEILDAAVTLAKLASSSVDNS